MMNLFFAGAGACIASEAYKHSNSHVSRGDVDDVYNRKLKDIKKSLPASEFSTPDLQALRERTEIKMNKMHKLEGQLDIGLGGMTGLSGIFAMLVKEKVPDPDADPKKGIAGLKEAVQHKPLAVAGLGYMVSTLCHAVSTTIAWNNATTERRKSVPFRAIFVGANIMAEILLAISSKGHGSGVKSDNTVDNTVISLAAEAIVSQPVGMQNALIEHVSRFLGRPDILAVKDFEVSKQLREQVELMRKNPWAACKSAAAEQPLLPAPAIVQEATRRVPKPMPEWQSKVTQDKGAGPQVTV
jgi:hypothetical protein